MTTSHLTDLERRTVEALTLCGPCRYSEVAPQIGLTRNYTGVLLFRMWCKGLIERSGSPRHYLYARKS